MILDVDPSPLGKLTIDGDLIADDTRDVNLTAKFIHIRAGQFIAGTESQPFLHKLTIQLSNNRVSRQYSVD
jgi:hypothetical protein